jgi:hypothetical protein
MGWGWGVRISFNSPSRPRRVWHTDQFVPSAQQPLGGRGEGEDEHCAAPLDKVRQRVACPIIDTITVTIISTAAAAAAAVGECRVYR